ncbi:hypothetical protein G4B88_021581 [Cannabis sativa]|uniref:RNase H type-1 domain-containing protein n=1 Tax=Cannabis sativa TaxID=3483 RepID=A0A7J6GIX2_CANSA|nr:hypothetical protein G4B88_021581 [Cannabis sativa]
MVSNAPLMMEPALLGTPIMNEAIVEEVERRRLQVISEGNMKGVELMEPQDTVPWTGVVSLVVLVGDHTFSLGPNTKTSVLGRSPTLGPDQLFNVDGFNGFGSKPPSGGPKKRGRPKNLRLFGEVSPIIEQLTCFVEENKPFWEYSILPSNASPVAKSIWATRRFIVDNSVWLLGIDANVKIGSQQWMGTNGEVMTLGDLNPMIEEGMCVGDLIMEDGRSSNVNLVNSWFRPDAAAAILKITLPFPNVETRLHWKDDPSGCFSLKSAYWRLNQNQFDCIDVVFKSLWKSHIHERLKVFLWRLGQNALPFGCKVASIFGSNVGPCMLCGLDEMDVVSHFVSGCNITRAMWFSSQWGVRVERCNLTNGRDVLAWLVDPSSLNLDSSGCEDFLLYGALLSAARGIYATRWGLPRPVRMKCFVDFASASDGGVVAAAIYDISGTIFDIAAAKVVVKSPLHGELEALRFGFDMAVQLGVDVGMFYSDNQTLVKAFIERSSPH